MNSNLLMTIKSAELVTLLVFVLALLMLFLLEARARNKRSGARKGKIESSAIVLSIEETGIYIDHRPQVKMQMQVMPAKGRNFVAEVEEFVPVVTLASIRTGSTVKVKYDPENHKEIRLVYGL